MTALIDKAMLASRYILAVFFLGLMLGLLLYAIRFLTKLWEYATQLFILPENEDLLGLLYLTDSALVASMVVMVAISSYDSLVSRLQDEAATKRMHWVGGLDTGDLKLKLATSIVAISSIHLLQIFLKPGSYDAGETMWALIIHGTFVLGALALGLLEWMSHKGEPDEVSPDVKEVHDTTPKEQRQEKE
ncbi:YqhA family protein [Pseudoroseomonas wenyumeiae]